MGLFKSKEEKEKVKLEKKLERWAKYIEPLSKEEFQISRRISLDYMDNAKDIYSWCDNIFIDDKNKKIVYYAMDNTDIFEIIPIKNIKKIYDDIFTISKSGRYAEDIYNMDLCIDYYDEILDSIETFKISMRCNNLSTDCKRYEEQRKTLENAKKELNKLVFNNDYIVKDFSDDINKVYDNLTKDYINLENLISYKILDSKTSSIDAVTKSTIGASIVGPSGLVAGIGANKIYDVMLKYSDKQIHVKLNNSYFKILMEYATKYCNDFSDNNQSTIVNVADEIKKFKELLDIGAITQDEYNKKKNELLNK